jgi:hypothetical protein
MTLSFRNYIRSALNAGPVSDLKREASSFEVQGTWHNCLLPTLANEHSHPYDLSGARMSSADKGRKRRRNRYCYPGVTLPHSHGVLKNIPCRVED